FSIQGNLPAPSGGDFAMEAPDGGTFIIVPSDLFSLDLSSFSPLQSLLLIIDGVDGFLGLIEDTFSGEIGGFTFPLVGDQLSDAADFISDFRKDFIDGLRYGVETAADPNQNFISTKLFQLLGPSGLNILLEFDPDADADDTVEVEDVHLGTNFDD